MATAMLMAWLGVTKKQYEQVMDRLGLDVNPPQGRDLPRRRLG
jgi:hypothetical protein